MKRALALVLGVAACGAPLAVTSAPPHMRTRAAVLRFSDTPLEGLGVPLPSPLVGATVGGHETTVVVDTGAHVPIISQWLADEAHVALGAASRASDVDGRAVTARLAAPGSLSIDGFGAPTGDVGALALPDAFRRIGIGGLVSPQALVTDDEDVELDLVARRMRGVPAGTTPAGGDFVLRDGRVCSYASGAMHARALVATLTIAKGDVVVDLDTGTNGLSLSTNAAARVGVTLVGGKVERGLGAAGVFEARVAPAEIVRFDDHAAAMLPVHVLGSLAGQCGAEGRLGMDVLRGCVLVVGKTSLLARCRAASLPPAPVSTGSASCDACVIHACADAATACARDSERCGAFGACAKPCAEPGLELPKAKACVEACRANAPVGFDFNQCIARSCREACGG